MLDNESEMELCYNCGEELEVISYEECAVCGVEGCVVCIKLCPDCNSLVCSNCYFPEYDCCERCADQQNLLEG